jgi:hypothetical protein
MVLLPVVVNMTPDFHKNAADLNTNIRFVMPHCG